VVKNSYLIYVLLKKLIFLERFLQHSTHLCTISLKKNTKINLKTRTKSSDYKFYRD